MKSPLRQLQAAIHEAERRGITRADISRKSGVVESQLSRIMANDKADPQLSTVTKLLGALKYDLHICKRKLR